MFAKVLSAQPSILGAHLIEVEINKDAGAPSLSVVGLPDKAVEEAKDRVSSAISNSNFETDEEFKTLKSSPSKITISLAPANIKKTGSVFDLAIAIAYLLVSEELEKSSFFDKTLFLGELSLSGDLKPIDGALSVSELAKEKGFENIILPYKNAKEASLIEGVNVYGFESLDEIVAFLRGEAKKEPAPHLKISEFRKNKALSGAFLDDIKGQDSAKRALQIAAAGGHNIALFGPPGTGKSMLAKAFANLLPDLSDKEALEVTKIHSASSVLRETVITRPPFRAPHHSASYVSIIGGGANLKPGEITLAHKGVLFMDEFPEFDKRVINSLREPLEERKITVSRATGSAEFPADFILIVALNPCPCGYYGTNKCTCTPLSVQKYQKKISGPIADRIDIWVEVSEVDYEKLLDKRQKKKKEHKKALENIKKAREIQKKRFGSDKLNAKMSSRDIEKLIVLRETQKELLNSFANKMNISARAYHKILKLARTIADMENSEQIKDEHILEALNYREKIAF